MEFKIITKNEEETMMIAENLETEKFAGMVICLEGELGSGKTVFVQGFARAMAIDETITSPTFTLVKEYSGEMTLFHMDVYRLKEECQTVGFDDYFNKNAVSIIEWADLICECLPEERLEIEFRIIDENTRVLIFKPFGKVYEDLCSAVL